MNSATNKKDGTKYPNKKNDFFYEDFKGSMFHVLSSLGAIISS